MKKCFVILFVSFFVTVFLSDSLLGIPAFARKYKMSCNVCHSPFPRLKDYGDEFAGNGFVLKDKDAPRYYTDTGDDKLSLIRDLPVAIRLEGYLNYNQGSSEQADFSAPYIIKLLSGGAITKKISYYFYFFFSERGEVAGLEDAFIYFNDLFGSGVALAVGQFQVSDPLFKRELRLTFEDYHIYKIKPGNSHINLAYDRGLMFSYGFSGGPDLTLEILNGSGIDEADSLRNFDTDKYKNIFGRVSQNIGDYFRLGACAYYGKEAQQETINTVWMLGADASLAFETVEFNVQYIDRKDDNPLFGSDPVDDLKTRGGLAEFIFTPEGDRSDWFAIALYNWIDSEQDDLDYESITANIGLLLRRNIRLAAEFTHILKGPQGKHSRFGIGLITAF